MATWWRDPDVHPWLRRRTKNNKSRKHVKRAPKKFGANKRRK